MREKRKNSSNLPWILACVLVVLALLVLVIALRHPAQTEQQPAKPSASVPAITPAGTPQNPAPASPQNGSAAENARSDPSGTEAGSSAAERVEPALPGEPDIPDVPAEPVPGEENASGKTPASPEEPHGTEEPSAAETGSGSANRPEGGSGETPPTSGKTSDPVIEPGETEPEQPVIIPQAVESSYERKLAAAGIMGLLMYAEDPDFSIDAVFLTGETPMEEYLESGGIYVIFTDSERTRCLHCAPLPAERTETGTVDMKSADLGWASFTYLDSMDPTGCVEVSVDDLEEELNQAMLVTLSEH